MNRRLIIAPLLAPSSWQASSSMALRKEICDPQYCCLVMVAVMAFLTDFFFEADIRSRHSCTTFLAFFFSWKTLLLCDID